MRATVVSTGFAAAVAGTIAAGWAAPVYAAAQVFKHFDITLKAMGQTRERLDCDTGSLLSGGYSLSLIAPSSGLGAVETEKLMVITNAPAEDTKGWIIGLANVGAVDMQVKFNIQILCG